MSQVATVNPEQLAAKQSIYELVCQYAMAVDKRDYAKLGALFTETCAIEGPGFNYTSRDEYMKGIHLIEYYDKTLHSIHNTLITLDNDSQASGEVYCVANHMRSEDNMQTRLDWGIRYFDQYVSTPSGWLFSSRKLDLHWTWEEKQPVTTEA